MMPLRVSLNNLLIASLLFLTLFHDYIFLNLEYYVGSNFSLNLWKEVLSIIFLTTVFFISLLKVNVKLFVVRNFLLFVFLFLLFLFYMDYTEESLRTFRSILTPLVFALMFSLLILYYPDAGVRCFHKVMLVLSISIATYGIYQYYSISLISDFWYYGPLEEKGYDLKVWNSFRDEKPRISSIFTSSLEFSFFVVSSFFILASYFWFGVKDKVLINKVAYGFLFLLICSFFFFAVMMSTVRSAQICLLGGLIYAFLLINLKSRLFIFMSGILFFIGLSAVTFLYIGLGYTEELSAEGRIVQWEFVLGNLVDNVFGSGFSGIGPTQEFWFDSLWLNLLYSLGVTAFIFFVLMFFVFYKVVNAYVSAHESGSRGFTALCFSSTILLPILLYASLFQAFYNSTVFYILCIICSVVIYGKNKIRN